MKDEKPEDSKMSSHRSIYDIKKTEQRLNDIQSRIKSKMDLPKEVKPNDADAEY